MSLKNWSVVLHKIEDLRLEERTISLPGQGEVQIAPSFVGICGTDIHYYVDGGVSEAMTVKGPIVLGHEGSGIVTKLGEGVTGIEIGDRVAIEPAVQCKSCRQCSAGRYNLCAHMKFSGLTPSVDGFCCRSIVHPADKCFLLPNNVSLEEGALIEPLSVGVYSCVRAGVKPGDKVLVCGAGPIAFASMLAARAAGAVDICVTGRTEKKLLLAMKLGANHTLRIDSSDIKEQALRVKQLFGTKPDVTIECSGAAQSIQLAIHATRPGGVVLINGCGPDVQQIPIMTAALSEIDIRGVVLSPNQFQPSIDLVSSGAIDVKQLISGEYPLEEARAAFEFKRNTAEAVKVLIKCQTDN